LSGAELVEESQSPAAAVFVKGGGAVEGNAVERVGQVLKEIAVAAGVCVYMLFL
jgi:hypothetical protein